MIPKIRMTLVGFHHKVAHHLSGIQPIQYMGGRWENLNLYVEMKGVGLEEVEKHVLHGQNTVTPMYLIGCIPAKRWATLWWNPTRVVLILGIISQVSDTNKILSVG